VSGDPLRSEPDERAGLGTRARSELTVELRGPVPNDQSEANAPPRLGSEPKPEPRRGDWLKTRNSHITGVLARRSACADRK
jgi:hypothetical protein